MSATLFLLGSLVLQADPLRIEPDTARGQSLAVRFEGGALVHTGQLMPRGPVALPTPPQDQILQVFTELRDTLQQAGSSLGNVIKLNVYVNHPSVTELVQKELATRYAAGSPPAVSYVQTRLPHSGTVVALDAIAFTTSAAQPAVTLLPHPAEPKTSLAAVLPRGGAIYVSGQAEKGDGTMADATTKTMDSLWATLKFLGSTPQQVVQVKAFLTPMESAAEAVKAIQQAFGDLPCAPIVLVEWESTLPIEIELVVASPLPATNVSPAPEAVEYLTPPGMTASPVYCRVARVNVESRLYVSGLYGTQPAPSSGDEVREIFDTLQRALTAGGSSLKHLAKATYYVSDTEVSQKLNDLRPLYYDAARPPAASKAQVAGVARPPRTITLDMIAVPVLPRATP